MAPKKHKIEAGNVYLIPFADKQYGVRQVVLMDGGPFYFVVFDQIVSSLESDARVVERVTQGTVELFGLTLHGRILSGDWKYVGNFSVVADFPLPAYKYGGGPTGKYMVHDYARRYLREATDVEAATVPNETTDSPMHFVFALRALHNGGDWKDFLETILPKYVVPYQKIFGDDA